MLKKLALALTVALAITAIAFVTYAPSTSVAVIDDCILMPCAILW